MFPRSSGQLLPPRDTSVAFANSLTPSSVSVSNFNMYGTQWKLSPLAAVTRLFVGKWQVGIKHRRPFTGNHASEDSYKTVVVEEGCGQETAHVTTYVVVKALTVTHRYGFRKACAA